MCFSELNTIQVEYILGCIVAYVHILNTVKSSYTLICYVNDIFKYVLKSSNMSTCV